jgi:hypothetical protein
LQSSNIFFSVSTVNDLKVKDTTNRRCRQLKKLLLYMLSGPNAFEICLIVYTFFKFCCEFSSL